MSTNLNQDICDMLMKLAHHERDVNGVIYKYHAYRKASKTLETHGKRIKSGPEAQKLSGIGPKIAQKIDEFLQNNKKASESAKQEAKRLNKANDNPNNYLIKDYFEKMYPMTKSEALSLEICGIRTIGELKNQSNQLSTELRTCVEYFDDLCKTIPRIEIKDFKLIIMNLFKKIPNVNLKTKLCGQYRRKFNDCDSIDVLVVDLDINTIHFEYTQEHVNVRTLYDFMMKENFIKKLIEFKNNRLLALIKFNENSPYRLLNMYFASKLEYVCTLLHMTGTNEFCKKLSLHCLKKGFILNEKTLRKIGTNSVPGLPIKIKTEKELFQYIEYPYVEPQNRN